MKKLVTVLYLMLSIFGRAGVARAVAWARFEFRGAVGALACLLGLLALSAPTESHATTETRLTIVTSSPTSWVARGFEDYTVSPDIGWTFIPSRNYRDGVSFHIRGPALPGTTVDHWFLDFAAPFRAEITPGFYPDFQRFPFQDPDRPGLAFGSTGRLDNRASGFFEVFEATYDPSGDVLSFSADFTHFGETNPNNFAIVELRYNVIPALAQVSIDIRPWSDTNPVNPFARGVIPVAILSSEDFDVMDVDVATLVFGPSEAASTHPVGGHFQDVNGDGLTDLLSHYWIQDTGIAVGHTEACVTGETLDGTPLAGCDFINTEPNCGNGFEVALVLPPLVLIGGRMRRRRRH